MEIFDFSSLVCAIRTGIARDAAPNTALPEKVRRLTSPEWVSDARRLGVVGRVVMNVALCLGVAGAYQGLPQTASGSSRAGLYRTPESACSNDVLCLRNNNNNNNIAMPEPTLNEASF
jgi:hypothetical protein